MRGTAVVLAAGQGTRMRSSLAKVLHPLLGRTMAGHVVAAVREAGLDPVVVVHHQEEAVRAALPDCRFARQEAPRGTGDAVRSALSEIPEDGVVVVLCGDAPLVRALTLETLLRAHAGRACTVVTARARDPGGYGRLVRDAKGVPQRIVEASEATPDELSIDEVNSGLYAFDAAFLRRELPRLVPHPPKGELYLTDLVEVAGREKSLGVLVHDDLDELLGVNDRHALSVARGLLQERLLRAHALAGVTFEHPASTTVEVEVVLGPDVTVGSGAVLCGRTVVEEGALIGPHVVLEDCHVGRGARVLAHSVCTQASVGPGSSVGPMAHLREGAQLGPDVRVGNFVEVKNTTLDAGAKASHLSYLGDGHVGEGANIGAGTIFCNYDGVSKWQTHVGAHAFIGSNTALVAPVAVGEGAVVAAGSTITKDVPAEALAVGRARQENKPGRGTLVREQAKARRRS